MELGSFDVFDTVVFPVVGGIIAGTIVVTFEWGFRKVYEWQRRRKAEKAIGEFFGEWQSKINNAEDLFHPPSGKRATRLQMQFKWHESFLRQFPIRLSRWSKFLSERQVEEITLFVQGEENSLVEFLPERKFLRQSVDESGVSVLEILSEKKIMSQEMYDDFFLRAKRIKWLKF